MDEPKPLVASELSMETICGHLRIAKEYLQKGEEAYIEALRRSAIAYVCDHCNVTPGYVDGHEDLAVAVLVLIADMYDQRGRYVDASHPNRTVEAILSHHDYNLVPGIETAGGDDDAAG